MEKHEFKLFNAEFVSFFTLYYPQHELNPAYVVSLFNLLSKYSLPEIISALSSHVMTPITCKKPPLPGDIVAQIEKNQLAVGNDGWTQLVALVRNYGAYKQPSLTLQQTKFVESVGGWQAFCGTLSEFNFDAMRKNFNSYVGTASLGLDVRNINKLGFERNST